jgi:hypothetical protein
MLTESAMNTGNKALDKLQDCYRKGAGAVPYQLFMLMKTRAEGRSSGRSFEEISSIEKTYRDELMEGLELSGHLDFDELGTRVRATDDGMQTLSAAAPLEVRALNRAAYQEVRRQTNLEQIMLHAVDDLLEGDACEDEPVDENWCFRFFAVACTACTTRMQTIWGQLLAREIRKPRSFSFRTLELLKNATADVIDAIVKASRLRLRHGQLNFIAYPDNFNRLERELGLSVTQVLLLQQVGAVTHDTNIRFTLAPTDVPETIHLRHGRKVLSLSRKAGCPGLSVPAIIFTSIGLELSSLVGGRENREYIKGLANQVRSSCTKVVYADVQIEVAGELMTENEEDI